jgi:hypothetical protein
MPKAAPNERQIALRFLNGPGKGSGPLAVLRREAPRRYPIFYHDGDYEDPRTAVYELIDVSRSGDTATYALLMTIGGIHHDVSPGTLTDYQSGMSPKTAEDIASWTDAIEPIDRDWRKN